MYTLKSTEFNLSYPGAPDISRPAWNVKTSATYEYIIEMVEIEFFIQLSQLSDPIHNKPFCTKKLKGQNKRYLQWYLHEDLQLLVEPDLTNQRNDAPTFLSPMDHHYKY